MEEKPAQLHLLTAWQPKSTFWVYVFLLTIVVTLSDVIEYLTYAWNLIGHFMPGLFYFT